MKIILEKMQVKWQKPVQYSLQSVDGQNLILNDWIGKNIQLKFDSQIFCIHCNQPTKKSFGQGYCYKHFISLAQCDMCIMKPETCHFDKGTCREPQWGQEHCMIPHIVYISDTSSVKIGITREYNMRTRWVDQGATQAMAVFRVPNRKLAGLVEVRAKEFLADKTNWRKMLSGNQNSCNLNFEKQSLLDTLKIADLSHEVLHSEIEEIDYPVQNYPQKIQSLSFDKTNIVSGKLLGVKAQYLILDTGVLNIRKHSGYQVELSLI